MKSVVIIDYGMGNLKSVSNACEYLGMTPVISRDGGDIIKAERLILPGVGAFPDAVKALKEHGLFELIKRQADVKPMLGICLGMQLLFDKSCENGVTDGLSLINGEIVKIGENNTDEQRRHLYKIPHIGWNKLELTNSESPLIKNLPDVPTVYFVHSYKADVKYIKNITAITEYGESITAIAENALTFGTQFHPEKSGETGLQILKNFFAIT